MHHHHHHHHEAVQAFILDVRGLQGAVEPAHLLEPHAGFAEHAGSDLQASHQPMLIWPWSHSRLMQQTEPIIKNKRNVLCQTFKQSATS